MGKSVSVFLLPLTITAILPPHLPRNVGLPASPCFTEVLEDSPSLVLSDTLRHHIQDVMHHRCPQFKVKVALHSLLGNSLGHTL